MSGFFTRVSIIGDRTNGTHVYIDGAELKGCVEAKLELEVDKLPMLTVKTIVDEFEVDLEDDGVVKDAEES